MITWSLKLKSLLVVLAVFSPSVALHAAPVVDENVCILENMGNTRSSVARSHISAACNFLSQPVAGLQLNSEQRAFSECVLKYLPGIEVNMNATQLARSCRQLSWDSKVVP